MLDLFEKLFKFIVQKAQYCRHCTGRYRKKKDVPSIAQDILHNLQCWSESEVNIKREPLQKIPELKLTNSETQTETGTTTTQQSISDIKQPNATQYPKLAEDDKTGYPGNCPKGTTNTKEIRVIKRRKHKPANDREGNRLQNKLELTGATISNSTNRSDKKFDKGAMVNVG